MSDELTEYRMELENEEAMNKVARLQEIYEEDVDGDIKAELYDEAIEAIGEKIAAWEEGDDEFGLEPMSSSSQVTLAASIAEEAYDMLCKQAAAEQLEEELMDVDEEIDWVLKQANIDLDEVLDSDDPELIDDVAELSAALLEEEDDYYEE